MNIATRPPRSFLFLPATRLERLDKALTSGADAVIIDLEDAVAPADKAAARAALANAAAPMASAAPGTLWLRINAMGTREASADLDLWQALPAPGIVLPKTQGLDELRALPPGCPVLALIESAQGLAMAPRLGEVPAVVASIFSPVSSSKSCSSASLLYSLACAGASW